MTTSSKTSSLEPVDVRAYHPLARLRRIIRAYVTLEGVLSSLVFVALWFWVTLALDFGLHYFAGIDLLDNAGSLRYVLIIFFSGLVAAMLVFFVLRRSFRDFSSASLALVLENKFPELLGDRLITAVELSDLKRAAKQGYSTEMILKTMKDAKERVDQVEVRKVFNWRRLIVLSWIFFSVTVIALVAVYPASSLFSLIKNSAGDNLSSILLYNIVALVGCLFCFVLPLLAIYAWKKQRKTAYFMLGSGIIFVAITGFSFGQALNTNGSMSFREFSWRFYHVAGITMNRDLKFSNERWPADHYFVEWIDFSVPEKRVEMNKSITVRAYLCRFIVADPSAAAGWRPVAWRDLGAVLPGVKTPELPLDQIHDYLVRLNKGLENSPVGYDARKLELPTTDNINVDLAVAAVTDGTLESPMFTDEQREEFEELAKKLADRAANPEFGGRVLRNVNPPVEMKMVAMRLETERRQTAALRNIDDRNFVFQLEQPIQLEESIRIHVEAKFDDKTANSSDRLVTLVLPPRLRGLAYQEFRPAYFYYLPPEPTPRMDTMDERRKVLANYRQPLRPSRTVFPPDQFTFNIFRGSEVIIRCETDKPLREAYLIPRSAEFPGAGPKEEQLPIRLQIGTDDQSFVVQFKSDGKPAREWLANAWARGLPSFLQTESWRQRALTPVGNPVFPNITRTTDFELVFKDTDNMTSNRFIKVKSDDDKPPEVNLYVDVIRRVKNRYMCTARAEIPFAKESFATDDYGLHKIEMTYEYSRRTSDVEAGKKAEMAAWLWASSPILPSIGDFIYRREILLRTVRPQKSAVNVVKGAFPVRSFDSELLKFAGNAFPTLKSLESSTAIELPDHFAPTVMKRYEFKNDEKPEVFDLRDRLPRLMEKDPVTDIQPIYDMIVNVRVTDSNVLAESDRTSENKEAPLVFEVVPDDVLFGYISREEADLARKFDDVIKRVETAHKNLQGCVSRISSLSLETATSEQTRLETVLEAISKSRESTSEIANDFARILREYEVNRFEEKVSSDRRSKIVDPLKEVQTKEFARADEAVTGFHGSMKNADLQLAQPLAGPALVSVDQLLKRLNDIRANMTEAVSLNRIRNDIQEMINKQNESKRDLNQIEQDFYDILLNIKITAPAVVNVAAGMKVKVPVKLRMPETLTSDPFLRFEIGADSGLSIDPKEIKLKDDSTSAEFEIAAGKQTGSFSIRIVPTQGKPVDMKVVVK